MIGSWHPTPMKLRGSALILGVALASPAFAHGVAPAQTIVPDADKSAHEAPAPPLHGLSRRRGRGPVVLGHDHHDA